MMDAFRIDGGTPLTGELRVHGSKNAALPMLALALLTDQPLVLADVPALADIENMLKLLAELGCVSSRDVAGGLTLHTPDASESHARYEIVRTMRASICTLGPLLAARGRARVSLPGGCAIGERPVDLHLAGLRGLGAHIELDAGDIVATAPRGGLVGSTVFLGGAFGSTVLGTANVMSAATLARGTTVIESAACEPEIVDVARALTAMGAKIEGAGSPRVTIHGVESLTGATHTVMPDRIEAGTLMIAGAITRGNITLSNCPLDALMAATDRLQAAGVSVEQVGNDDPWRARCTVSMKDGKDRPDPIQITTQPHPGFPTDLQAQFMSLACLARGNSVVTEKIFPERFLHAAELSRMGAQIARQAGTAVISGVDTLIGARVMASDLRASAGLVLAGLAAEGTTVVNRVYHLDRGYEALETRLASVGARFERVKGE